ncbi:unnamed protein product [Blumeria hordei]|uniref:Uncharacterized protein n=2 Tax=Blumeria hordei TaxID=2867405 RepID=A0A383UXR3_BLUHO|nr:peroxisomal multifunctional enzyme type 2 [Blumeria hordei DH14]SZF04697.1 unnamed protein product [Blumeria hordei]
MSGPGVGFEYPSVEVSWLQRDLLLFANSIGCKADELNFLFELHPEFSMFPTYPIILPFKKNSLDVVDFYAAQNEVQIPNVPKLDPTRVVDGQRHMQFFRPLPTTSHGRKFELRSKVLGVYDKGKAGTVLESQLDLVDAENGDLYVRALSSFFYVGQGQWGGPKGQPTPNFAPPAGKAPDSVSIQQTTPETALLYRLNGDYNPLHATPEPGQMLGFGGTIIHGLYSWNVAAHAVLKSMGGGKPENIKEFQARFSSPVRPGDKLITEMWRTGIFSGEFEEIRFQTRIEGGKVCLNNGRALIRPVKSQTKL